MGAELSLSFKCGLISGAGLREFLDLDTPVKICLKFLIRP